MDQIKVSCWMDLPLLRIIYIFYTETSWYCKAENTKKLENLI